MSKELNDLLKQAYNKYKDVPNPPVPIHGHQGIFEIIRN